MHRYKAEESGAVLDKMGRANGATLSVKPLKLPVIRMQPFSVHCRPAQLLTSAVRPQL